MKKRVKYVAPIFVILISLIIGSLHLSKYGLSITNYEIQSDKVKEHFRIVQLSDQHGTVFGENNHRLIEKVDEASPDLILITGDLINAKVENLDKDLAIVQDYLGKLCGIAPVYISLGNHENACINDGVDIYGIYEETGVKILDFQYNDILIKSQEIRLGGIYGYCLRELYAPEVNRVEESAFLLEYQDTESLKILMCHMPVCWLGGSLYDWDVDCVFSGHAHGGQIRIPFIGGLWAPDQGWFPGKESGIYSTSLEGWKEYYEWMQEKVTDSASHVSFDLSRYQDYEYRDSYLILSRGLGNTEKIPRWNNIPEIVVVDYYPEG